MFWSIFDINSFGLILVLHYALYMVFSILFGKFLFHPTWLNFRRKCYCLSLIKLDLFLPLSPPGWRGIVVTVRAAGRAAAKLAEPISL